MIRAFVALPLALATRQELTLIQFLLPLPQRVEPENLHLTLAFLGTLPEPLLEEAHHALDAIVAGSFTLTLRGLGLFGGSRPRLVYAAADPNPALTALQRKVATAVRRAGVTLEARRFVPHVTLGRFAPPPPDATMRLERALAQNATFACTPAPVEDFVLYRSDPGRGGTIYSELARYPLRGGAAA